MNEPGAGQRDGAAGDNGGPAKSIRKEKVTRQLHYHGAGHSFGPPKSRAGVRDVDFAELIAPDLR